MAARSRESRRKRQLEARARRSIGRRKPQFDERERLLVVCEGAKTERVYFEALRAKYRLRTVDVVVCGSDRGTDPVSVVECALDRRKAEGFNHVWCVIDTESYRKARERKLSAALDLARQNEIQVAISNPCFEFWYLLHFERHAGSLGRCSKVVTKLHEHLPGYHKGTNVFDTLDPLTDTAIQNAASINHDQWTSEPDYLLRDPSTEAHEIVKLIRHIHRQGPQLKA